MRFSSTVVQVFLHDQKGRQDSFPRRNEERAKDITLCLLQSLALKLDKVEKNSAFLSI